MSACSPHQEQVAESVSVQGAMVEAAHPRNRTAEGTASTRARPGTVLDQNKDQQGNPWAAVKVRLGVMGSERLWICRVSWDMVSVLSVDRVG